MQEVRSAVMSDFFNIATLLGDIRERMAELCGDDSTLDQLDEDGAKRLDQAQMQMAVAGALDDYADDAGMDFSDIQIVKRSHVVKPE